MKYHQLKQMDQARLREAFHHLFDRSKAEHWLRHFDRLEGQAQDLLVGEGTHFRTLRLPPCRPWPRGEGDAASLTLVMKRALPTFGDAHSPGVRRWAQNLLTLAAAPPPLAPPMEVVWADQAVGLVMPFGADGHAAAAPHWQPIGGAIENFETHLRGLGMALQDMVQIRVWEGIPFVVDFSDLKSIGQA